jgi:hypothetical protein
MEEEKKPRLTTKGKVRKELTPDALDKLAKAREKANAIRKEGAIRKMEAKVEAHRGKATDIAGNELDKEETEKDIGGNDVPVPDDEPEGVFDKVKEKLISDFNEEQEEPEVKVVKKKSSKKKPVVIIEQSSSDDEEFEDKKNVIFVKRASRKKKEPVVVPEPQLASSAPPEPPPQPPRPPQLSRQQAIFNQTYDSMFNGGFLRNRFY